LRTLVVFFELLRDYRTHSAPLQPQLPARIFSPTSCVIPSPCFPARATRRSLAVWSSRCRRCCRIRLASLDTAHPKVCSLTSPCRPSTRHWALILLSRVLGSFVSSAWHRTSSSHTRSRSPPLGLASPGPRRRPASVLTASVRLGLTTARTLHLFAHTPSDLDRLTSFFVASVVLAPSDPCSYSPLRFRGVNRARAVKRVWDV
jgi:hypothetical protein